MSQLHVSCTLNKNSLFTSEENFRPLVYGFVPNIHGWKRAPTGHLQVLRRRISRNEMPFQWEVQTHDSWGDCCDGGLPSVNRRRSSSLVSNWYHQTDISPARNAIAILLCIPQKIYLLNASMLMNNAFPKFRPVMLIVYTKDYLSWWKRTPWNFFSSSNKMLQTEDFRKLLESQYSILVCS